MINKATVLASGASTTITGTLNSTGNTTFALEFFANVAADSTGYGEGQTYLGTVDVTTDTSGNGSFTFSYAGDLTGLKISGTATDPTGNTSEFAQNVTGLKVPTVALSVSSPTNLTTPQVTVTATPGSSAIPNGALAYVDVDLNNDGDYLDAGEVNYRSATLGSGGTATFSISPALAEGNYRLQARVTDAAGNEGTSATSSLLVDTTAPTVALAFSSPTSDTTPQVTVNASDAGSGIVGAAVHLDVDLNFDGDYLDAGEANYQIASLGSGGTATFSITSALADGNYHLRTRVSDAAGNEGTSATSLLLVDTTAPAVTLAFSSPTSDTTPQVTVNTSDAGSGVAGATVHLDVDLNFDGDYLDAGEADYMTATLSGGAVMFDIAPALAEGRYNLRARVSDAVGNAGFSSSQLLEEFAPTTVCNTSDSGAGSLRNAITYANSTAGVQTITFNLAGTGVQTIYVLSELPDITDPVVLDGTSQPGYAGVPLVALDGTSAGQWVDGLYIIAGSSTVKGLEIIHFSGEGIELATAGNNVIQGNYLGTDGASDQGNGYGLWITNVAGNTIGGTTPRSGQCHLR